MKKTSKLLAALILMSSLSGCASSKYAKAKSLIENKNYEEALEILEEISDYEDAASLIDNCNNHIVYTNSFKLMKDGKYKEAYEGFYSLSDFGDAYELGQECEDLYLKETDKTGPTLKLTKSLKFPKEKEVEFKKLLNQSIEIYDDVDGELHDYSFSMDNLSYDSSTGVLNTGAPGTYTFTVSAKDNQDNEGTEKLSYTVYDPTDTEQTYVNGFYYDIPKLWTKDETVGSVDSAFAPALLKSSSTLFYANPERNAMVSILDVSDQYDLHHNFKNDFKDFVEDYLAQNSDLKDGLVEEIGVGLKRKPTYKFSAYGVNLPSKSDDSYVYICIYGKENRNTKEDVIHMTMFASDTYNGFTEAGTSLGTFLNSVTDQLEPVEIEAPAESNNQNSSVPTRDAFLPLDDSQQSQSTESQSGSESQISVDSNNDGLGKDGKGSYDLSQNTEYPMSFRKFSERAGCVKNLTASHC